MRPLPIVTIVLALAIVAGCAQGAALPTPTPAATAGAPVSTAAPTEPGAEPDGTPIPSVPTSAATAEEPAPTAAPGAPLELTPDASGMITLPLPAGPEGPPTSGDLIAEALAAGEIDEETALLYHVYADFADPRLPAEYQGDDTLAGDGEVLGVQDLSGLSPQAQAALAPFLLPPSAPGSWLELAEASGLGPGLAAPAPAAIEWGTLNTANGKVKVWHQKRYAGDDAKAAGIVKALDGKIWRELTELMGREPRPDGGWSNNGGDARIDIYLVHMRANGKACAYDAPPSPGYILVDSRQPLGDETHPGIIQTVAHEMMHLFQFSYRLAEDWDEYAWLGEATATWAEHYVYPKAQSEHPFAAKYLDTPFLTLNDRTGDRDYGAYLLPYYLARKVTEPEIVRTIWECCSGADSFEAIDAALPVNWSGRSGLEAIWPDFVLADWNREPVDDYFKRDGLERGAVSGGGAVPVLLNGRAETSFTLPVDLPALSALYYHFTFPDDTASTITFYNGYSFKLSKETGDDGSTYYKTEPLPDEILEGRSVLLLAKVEGEEWTEGWQSSEGWYTLTADVTDQPVISYCRDAKAERLEELVIIFANSRIDRGYSLTAFDQKPVLRATNIGCWRWSGTLENTWEGLEAHAVAEVVFERRGPMSNGISFDLQEGTVEWRLHHQDGSCLYEGQASNRLDEDDIGLGIDHDTLAGPRYRSYSGSGLGGRIEWTVKCDDPDLDAEYQDSLGLWETLDEEREDETPPYLGRDGRTISGQSRWGNDNYRWHLTAERE